MCCGLEPSLTISQVCCCLWQNDSPSFWGEIFNSMEGRRTLAKMLPPHQQLAHSPFLSEEDLACGNLILLPYEIDLGLWNTKSLKHPASSLHPPLKPVSALGLLEPAVFSMGKLILSLHGHPCSHQPEPGHLHPVDIYTREKRINGNSQIRCDGQVCQKWHTA